ncbi:hypothetical protein ACFSTI_14355 [Rhizorhabdus histidinilytica]
MWIDTLRRAAKPAMSLPEQSAASSSASDRVMSKQVRRRSGQMSTAFPGH